MIEILTDIVRPPDSANSFTANGRKYIIYGDDMAVGVFQAFDRIQIEMKTAMQVDLLYKSLEGIWKDLEAGKTASASVKVYNLMTGAANIANDEKHPALPICTMFIMPEGHSRKQWDRDLAAEWINDWFVEGISIHFFITLASRFAQAFTGDLAPGSQDTFTEEA